MMNQFGMSHSDLYPTVYTKPRMVKGQRVQEVDVEATVAARDLAAMQLVALRKSRGSQKSRKFNKRRHVRTERVCEGTPFVSYARPLPPAKVEAAPRRLKDMSSRKRRRLAAQAFNARRVEL